MTTFRIIARKVAANALGLVSIVCIVAAFVVQSTTAYGFALTDGGGRLTDLGAYLLFFGLMGVMVALLPLARWVDENGYWKGGE